MPKSRVRVHRLIVLLFLLGGFCDSMGAHLKVFQLWAWGSMIAEDAPRMGLLPAARKAVGGKDPCSYCLAIRKAENRDRSPDVWLKRVLEFQAIWSPSHRFLFPLALTDDGPILGFSSAYHRPEPELPPPDPA